MALKKGGGAQLAQAGLLLVGLGIGDEKGISLEALRELRKCSRVFAEAYTSLLPEGTLPRLERLIGKKIALLSRQEVEGEQALLEHAASERTALIVPGDPLVATTHISLLISAMKKGIPARILHASSIISAAISESGLQAYKFGKTATLAYWRDNYKPMAAYEAAAENHKRGLHTLLLLDIDEKLGPMKPSVAAGILLKMEKKAKKGIFMPTTKLVCLFSVGRSRFRRLYLSLSELLAGVPHEKDSLPATLVLPGKMHFLESEFLELL
ncbi:MAG: diphthine synthase [Candidatus Micrarchaeota archaeon]|nr:diphthine synthase [Candidatus Micrarchaeota archaeon]